MAKAMPLSVALDLTAAERRECIEYLTQAAEAQDRVGLRAKRWPVSGAPFREAARLLSIKEPLPRVEARLLLNATPRGPFRERLVAQCFTVGGRISQ